MAGDDLSVELLPARHGDCILLEWPDVEADESDRVVRMLIDCGPARAYTDISARLGELSPPRLDVLVLTHIDGDHIEGMIKLVNDADLGLDIGDVWYNGYPQLADELGPMQGEMLGALLVERGLGWNESFAGHAIRTPDPGQALTRVALRGGVTVTVLAPTKAHLLALRDDWDQVCSAAELAPGAHDDALELLAARANLNPDNAYVDARAGYLAPPDIAELARAANGTDTSVANQSSIVLLVERGSTSLLLAGDSTPSALESGLVRLLCERGDPDLALDAFKLPHHGSANNITDRILQLAPAARYLFSSNGSHYRHPDAGAVARVIIAAPEDCELVFNYRTRWTEEWDVEELRDDHVYRTRYPAPGAVGVGVALGSRDDAR